MKRTIAWVLFDTKPGDLLLRMIEQLTGLAIVEVGELDYHVEASDTGRAAAKSRAPTRV